jgi:IclR family acetate operon transcriptional repressor
LPNQSVLVALRVMEEIAAHQPIGVSAIARALGIAKTTAHRSLTTLADAGWISATNDRQALWSLSVRALLVGSRAVESHGGLRGIAVPVMEDLRRTTEETIHLLVRDRAYVVLIERLDGIKPVRVFNPLGGRASVFRTSAGKAIVSRLSGPDLEACLEVLRARSGQGGMPDYEVFMRELAEVRRSGFAINLAGNQPDVHAVAAPILDGSGYPVAAITVSSVPERLPKATCIRIAPLVIDAARRIGVGLRAAR